MRRKITYNRMRKFIIKKGKSISLFQSNYIQLQSVVSSITPQKYTVQAVPSKKKKNPQERKRKGKRDGKKEKKNKEMEKRRRRRKGWKEFVRKERKNGE